jgi:hypothetical protein
VQETAIIKDFSRHFSFLAHCGHKLDSALRAKMVSKYMKNSLVFPQPLGSIEKNVLSIDSGTNPFMRM